VLSTSTESPVWDAAIVRRRRGFPPPWQWPEHWPLTALVLGFPLWWVLGMAQLMPLVLLAVAMPVAYLGAWGCRVLAAGPGADVAPPFLLLARALPQLAGRAQNRWHPAPRLPERVSKLRSPRGRFPAHAALLREFVAVR
jgi:hypothetical protein